MTDQKELIPMRPGDILRYQREQEGLTVERAAERSRISPATIQAIETGETSDIPSVYLKGYIRNYARFLGVDPQELNESMDTVKGSTPELRSVFTSEPRPPSAERWIKASSYVAASVLIAALAWQFTHEAMRFSEGSSAFSRTVEFARSQPEENASNASPSKRHLNASIASVEMIKQRDQEEAASAAQQAWSAVSEPGNDTLADVVDVHSLSITTSADTWVEITDARGLQLEMDLVRADNTRNYKGEAPFQVMIGRASAVLLNMDGKAIDLGPYTRGNVARMTLGMPLAAQNTTPEPEPDPVD